MVEEQAAPPSEKEKDSKRDSLRQELSEFRRTEAERHVENPYIQSTAVELLQRNKTERKPLKIAFLDIDSTITGDPEKQTRVRQLLEAQGYVIVFVTSRTEEMVMSKSEYEKSQEYGFTRPAPKLGKDGDINVPLFADEVDSFQGLYNPNMIAGSTGSSSLLIQQKEGGYLADRGFVEEERRYKEQWRESTMQLLQQIDPEKKFGIVSEGENPEMYTTGRKDVYPPDFRIAVEFNPPNVTLPQEHTGSTAGGERVAQDITTEGIKRESEYLQQFYDKLQKAKSELRDQLLSESLEVSQREIIKRQLLLLNDIRITDDSNPEKGKFAVYITPTRGYKARAVENITNHLTDELGVTKGELEILIAGDSYPDLAMGLYGGTGTNATFLLASGSRLTKVLVDKETKEFSGNQLSAVKNRLTEHENGEYIFEMPIFGDRNVIIGDQAFPGMTAVDSVIAYLEQQAQLQTASQGAEQ